MNAFGQEETLIATVGTESQVVTLILDSLLSKGCNIGVLNKKISSGLVII